MTSMNVDPPSGPGDQPLVPPAKPKKPIREILELGPDSDDNVLKAHVTEHFLGIYVRHVLNMPDADAQLVRDEVGKRAKELIRTEYAYAAKNEAKKIESTKQKLRLASNASDGDVYAEQLLISMRQVMSTIVGTEWRIPPTVESREELFMDMWQSVFTVLI